MIKIFVKHYLKKIKLNPSQILVIGFLCTIVVGALLLRLPISSVSNDSVSFIDAIFTATSAVCVTGLVVVDTGTYWTTFGQTVILIIIQIGALGLITTGAFIAILLGKKISLRNRLIMQEELNQFTISGVVKLVKYIISTTLIIEGIGAILLAIEFIPLFGFRKGVFYSAFHSISAFCNAGFDLIGNFRSLTPFVDNVLVNIVMWILIIIGGIGFTVINDLFNFKEFKGISLHSKFVLTLTALFILIPFVFIFILEYNNINSIGNLGIKGKMLASMFHSITPRTAGFNTLDLSQMASPTIFLTIIFMFIGGSPGSTAGGVKTTTIGLLMLSVISIVKGRTDTEIFDRRISNDLVSRALAIIFIGILWVIVVTMILSISEPSFEFLEILFEAVSAFGTVGLSLGMTTHLSLIGKTMIIITMFVGRVGPMTAVLALARKQQKNQGKIRYPEGKILVG